MGPNATAAVAGRADEKELTAIDQVIEEMRPRLNASYFSTTRQVALRLKRFLSENSLTLAEMIERNLGQQIAGPEGGSPQARDLNKNCLRGVLEVLCAKGLIALAFDKCIFPAPEDMSPHRDPRGMLGYAEAVTSLYPKWLIPERFQRAIDANAAMPKAVREEFRVFARELGDDLNEASLRTYWGNVTVLVASTGIQSLDDLGGERGVPLLQKAIIERGFKEKTSTLVHWRRILDSILGPRSPFALNDDRGVPLIKAPKADRKPVIAEGRSFHKNHKKHKVINGIITECRIRPADLRRLVHYESKALKEWKSAKTDLLPELFRAAQEDVLVKFWCIIKDRPVEAWSRNVTDWKLYLPQADNPDSQLFNGDGVILNNYRESVRKARPDKPFPKWLGRRLEELWRVRRAYFATKGDCDNVPSKDVGLLRVGVPLWVDPRTGARVTDQALRAMLRRGLIRSGMDEVLAESVSGYWFRKGVISAEWAQGKLDEHLEKTGGHKPKTAHRYYITEDLAPLVVHERETYWRFLGINQAAIEAGGAADAAQSPAQVKQAALKLLERLKEQVPALQEVSEGQLERLASSVAFDRDGRLSEKEAAVILSASKSTVRRWVELGLIEKYREGGRVFFLKAQLQSFLDAYAFVSEAARTIGCSTGYVRRLCRLGRIEGSQRVGAKSFLVPRREITRLMRRRKSCKAE
ncbi:MAG: helix-turn-helix domain-containing protein [Elusimicrobiota bacterium]|nr:MAG: helix-turn-helix domain-containing protein [Elusimicrobiota bacterium]